MIVVGAGVTFIAPEVAAGLVTLLGIYKVTCTTISASINLAHMLEALYNDDYERAGRHFVQLGFDICSFECVAKSLRPLFKIKIFGSNETFMPKLIDALKICKDKLPIEVIDTWKKINDLPHDVIDKKEFLESLAIFNNLPKLYSNDCPFGKIKQIIKKQDLVKDDLNGIRGAWYEIKKALQLFKQGIKIEQLGVIYTTTKGKKEFDIETPTALIECKNIKWIQFQNFKDLPKNIQDNVTELKSKLKMSKTIAEEFIGKKFELHSKNPIPQNWKEWLASKNINFIEDNLT